jgi:hypothetical protein
MQTLDVSIKEGNKLIAEFMMGLSDSSISFFPPDRLKYHSSWDWLMPVVEKITQIEDGKFNVTILSHGDWACYIERDDVFEKAIADFGGFEPMILNVWKAIVKFIKWYNKAKLCQR